MACVFLLLGWIEAAEITFTICNTCTYGFLRQTQSAIHYVSGTSDLRARKFLVREGTGLPLRNPSLTILFQIWSVSQNEAEKRRCPAGKAERLHHPLLEEAA